MRILFCDDDQKIVSQLHSYVSEFFSGLGGMTPNFAFYNSGDELLVSDSLQADIAFLDVEMPGVNGIHVGGKLKEANPNVKIFIVTSYPDYLDEAMRFRVFRYLSKPIDKNRLFRNLKDAIYQYHLDSYEYAILTANSIVTRRSDEILCVEACERKVLVYTTKEILVSINNMDYWHEKLKIPCFFATHRSYIVNMKYIDTIQKDRVLLRSSNTLKEAYLTRRKYVAFKSAYLMYIESVK